jgi:hypothetical protein
MQKSEQLGELFSALSKAQSELKTAIKDSTNPFFKNKYTSLDGCWDACRGPLSSNGLTIVQVMGEESGKPVLTTVLGHSSGQFISSTMPLMILKQDPQGLGSALSYVRRYALCAIVGITQGDDDDGEKAMESHRRAPPDISPVSFTSKLLEVANLDEPVAFYRVDEFLAMLSKERNISVPKVMEQALNPANAKRFINSYEKWYDTL